MNSKCTPHKGCTRYLTRIIKVVEDESMKEGWVLILEIPLDVFLDEIPRL
jgi:hypothetical protein